MTGVVPHMQGINYNVSFYHLVLVSMLHSVGVNKTEKELQPFSLKKEVEAL